MTMDQQGLSTSDIEDIKATLADWIRAMTLGGSDLPDALKATLLDQLAEATPFTYETGEICIELPALASMGVGIFRKTFSLRGRPVCACPYPGR